MREIDYLIIGQGIAGSLLAYRLIKAEKSVHIIDSGLNHSASIVAAGIVNPVTGRYYVKSWKFEKLLRELISLYTELEDALGISLLKNVDILRTLFNTFDQNKWMSKSAREGYSEYLGEIKENHKEWEYVLARDLPLAVTHCGKLVNLPLLVNTLRSHWSKSGVLEMGFLDAGDILYSSDCIVYRDIRCKHVIFCEGNMVNKNPFFRSLPINGYIGEILKVRIPSFKAQSILKQKSFLVPLDEDLFWFGPYNHPPESIEDIPSVKGRQELVESLKNIITVPFEIEEHSAGIRPTVEDRRPVLGTHPQFPRLHIFNGLGTKGASLAPYFSEVMMNYLVFSKPIPIEVNLSRFDSGNAN